MQRPAHLHSYQPNNQQQHEMIKKQQREPKDEKNVKKQNKHDSSYNNKIKLISKHIYDAFPTDGRAFQLVFFYRYTCTAYIMSMIAAPHTLL